MKKILLALMALAAILMGTVSTAGAATIDILNLRGETLNFEVQGRKTFQASSLVGEIRIVCDTTLLGDLRARIVGPLEPLLANQAGIAAVRVSRCTGAEAVIALNTLARPVKLSVISAPRVLNGPEPAVIGGNEAEFLIRVFGINCLYRAELKGTATRTEARALYTRVRLELLREESIALVNEERLRSSGFCPRRARMIGESIISSPAGGIGAVLLP